MKQVTKTETRNIYETRITDEKRSFGRRLLTAALNGIWWNHDGVDSRTIVEFLNIDPSGSPELREKYGIKTLKKSHRDNYHGIVKRIHNEQIEVEGKKWEYPIVGTEEVVYYRYEVDMDAYEYWYRREVQNFAFMARGHADRDGNPPSTRCWVEYIKDDMAHNVSFDTGSGTGSMPMRFLTPVYE